MLTLYKENKNNNEKWKIENIPPKELDRLLGHFYRKMRSASGSLYEPALLLPVKEVWIDIWQKTITTYSIIRDSEFSSSQQLLIASNKKSLHSYEAILFNQINVIDTEWY